jgi:hypothetical protein
MRDTQSQGPQCTACGSTMKLAAIEPTNSWVKICERLRARIVEGYSNTLSKVR